MKSEVCSTSMRRAGWIARAAGRTERGRPQSGIRCEQSERKRWSRRAKKPALSIAGFAVGVIGLVVWTPAPALAQSVKIELCGATRREACGPVWMLPWYAALYDYAIPPHTVIPRPGGGQFEVRTHLAEDYRSATWGQEIDAWLEFSEPVPASRVALTVNDLEFGVVRVLVDGGAGPQDFRLARVVEPNDLDYRWDAQMGELRPVGQGTTETNNGTALLYGVGESPVTRVRLVSEGLSEPQDWVGFGFGLAEEPGRDPAHFTDPPDPLEMCAAMGRAEFSALAEGTEPITYAWWTDLDGLEELQDGELWHNGVLLGMVSGSKTNQLVITSLEDLHLDREWLDLACVATNLCGDTWDWTRLTLQEPGLWIDYHPHGFVTVCGLRDGEFQLWTHGIEPRDFRWQAELDPGVWTDLADGPLYRGPVKLADVYGSRSDVLLMAGLRDMSLDRTRLELRCLVSNPCLELTSEPCTLRFTEGDLNGDEQSDFFDYLDFVAGFDAGDPVADINGDEQIDFFDYLDFIAAWDHGCIG